MMTNDPDPNQPRDVSSRPEESREGRNGMTLSNFLGQKWIEGGDSVKIGDMIMTKEEWLLKLMKRGGKMLDAKVASSFYYCKALVRIICVELEK